MGDTCNIMSKQVTLGEQFQKQTFEALALQGPGGHFLIFHLQDHILLIVLTFVKSSELCVC